tara:strand:+ start:34 stop:561 length:528 start_codon:yes stop_codon:yes gene_type:complete
MAFKMTPGIKGNPSMNRIKNLGACGGPNQPPCEPRFQKEVEEKQMKAMDRSSSSRSKSVKAKIKQSPIKDAPVKPAPAPKLQINLPKGYEFKDKLQKQMFYDMFTQAIDKGKYKTQEDLDMAIMTQLKRGEGPVKPTDPEGPVVKPPIFEGPILEAPIKGGGEFEASPIKSVIKK